MLRTSKSPPRSIDLHGAPIKQYGEHRSALGSVAGRGSVGPPQALLAWRHGLVEAGWRPETRFPEKLPADLAVAETAGAPLPPAVELQPPSPGPS